MDDNTREIRDNETNVEEAMATIRENIRRGKSAGESLLYPDAQVPPLSCIRTDSESNEASHRDLAYINSNWDIHNTRYSIRSHRPFIGTILVKGRQLVHGEVRRYVDPTISWQTEFNTSVVRIINRTSQQCAGLDQRQLELEAGFSSFKRESDKKIAHCITSAKNELDSKIESTSNELTRATENLALKIDSTSNELSAVKENLDSKIESTSNELTATIKSTSDELSAVKENLDSKIDLSLKKLLTQADEDIQARAWIAHVLEERINKELAQKRAPLAFSKEDNTNYFLFEERFRGSRQDITQRQREFLPYFEKCSRVLDIGCGRGEFLEILKEHGSGGIGVDSDPDMVAYCRSRQLEVEQSDAVAYLETLNDKSLDGIFIDQVVEHLEPDYLFRLLALCHKKMKFGYYIIVETVNPLSFVSFANFYIDLTHKRPVHPETLQYLFRAAGFRECEKKFFSPVSNESRLKLGKGTADMDETERTNIEVNNHNVELLNTLLFGAQDYAIIGKK